MIKKQIFLSVLALGSLATAMSANAAQVDLSSFVNANLNTYYNGSVYPPNGGPITIGGIDFNLNSLPGGGTGIVQTSAGGNPDSYTIPIGVVGATTVYTIINSAFGVAPYTVGSLTFTGSGGATYVYNLTEGDNIRDHATTGYNILAPNVFATENFGAGDRLDVQQIILPSVFGSQTLVSATFTGLNNGNGDPFLAAITTTAGAVPEPSSWAMMLVGFAGLGFAGYRRKTTAQAA
jgi:hypothetical protein